MAAEAMRRSNEEAESEWSLWMAEFTSWVRILDVKLTRVERGMDRLERGEERIEALLEGMRELLAQRLRHGPVTE